ncbi:arabinogalactan endo-1,4-beta-galactosidase [soil metagenome]
MKSFGAFLIPAFLGVFMLTSCSKDNIPEDVAEVPQVPEKPAEGPDYAGMYRGADLSYVNEMQDCGGVYKNEAGAEVDPYEFFKSKGANLVRLRLWHNPAWTEYSNFDDVKKSMLRAKSSGVPVLLDFHYSDTWADPGNQIRPKAWNNVISNHVMADSVYQYTFKTLQKLSASNLLPKIVQIGNELNREILQPQGNQSSSINWQRNKLLINAGIKAVRDFSANIEIMLHIAQPENALWWFREATQNGITDYDWIGISYYPVWSTYSLNNLPGALSKLKSDFSKKVMIVETAYPHTLTDVDNANNILGQNALISGYAATPEGQKKYIMDLLRKAHEGGAGGVIYWEPAWISTTCSTLWGQGSHWDNATFFSGSTQRALPAFDFYDPTKY